MNTDNGEGESRNSVMITLEEKAEKKRRNQWILLNDYGSWSNHSGQFCGKSNQGDASVKGEESICLMQLSELL